MMPLKPNLELVLAGIIFRFSGGKNKSIETMDFQALDEKTVIEANRQRKSLRHQFHKHVASLRREETCAMASRIAAAGIAQGCMGFSLFLAGTLFSRLRRWRFRLTQPLAVKRPPVLRPALRQGWHSSVTGLQTALVDELLSLSYLTIAVVF
eukprot:Gregarina_sp_Poly_1__6317@NODE_335_length_9444_cov_64_484270_g283_i0_p8_GENE_NODE_335_length_9444_cov_64_484270_g283_i0NODE_335_length_9444_cov_64_484270_g283_i0_p8_ORF_typecomplete_len152_score21_62_NODE_335_length_9444_cov_64_484270_g283_i048825337